MILQVDLLFGKFEEGMAAAGSGGGGGGDRLLIGVLRRMVDSDKQVTRRRKRSVWCHEVLGHQAGIGAEHVTCCSPHANMPELLG
jgi:hypothetical protein